MKRAGQIALTPFPNTDLSGVKRRPVLLIRQASSRFDDWLVCMVSSQLHQAETGFDEFLMPQDPDFAGTGLKAPSVLRLSRIAVLDGDLLIGSIGAISNERLSRIRARLAEWLAMAP
ncbi:MAG: type II toxin-antitoxin system PemK/MazF family toxin [Gammaproteobacteria bacterium]|jgi:mRNA interferase MazF|nr:type II toxin-antitoxin system PemK/MazF family toxin [Gammaproteobacteria bacterium]